MEGLTFLCKGCGKPRPANPHLAPGVQQFCSLRACQLERKARWQNDRVASDSKYASDQREADACWHKNSAPNYHKEYDADRKRPPGERKTRRSIRRRARSRRRRAVTVAIGSYRLRISIARAPQSPQDRPEGTDIELVVVRVRPAPDQAEASGVGVKDGRVPAAETAIQSGS